jgi:hypothetical protein
MRRCRSGFVLVCCIAATRGALASSSEPHPTEIKLSVDGQIGNIVGVDLNGDGLKDLLVLSVQGRSDTAKRLASVFLQKPGRIFPPRADLVWELPPSIVALDPFTDDLPAAERGTIYSIDTDAIDAHRLDADGRQMTATRVLAADLSYLPAQKEATLLLDFAASWSGGPTEFLVPAFPDPLLFLPQDHGAGEPIALRIPPEPNYGGGDPDEEGATAPFRARFEFPRLVSSTRSADAHRVLLALKDSGIDVLDLPGDAPARGEGGRARRVVEPRSYPLDILTDDEVKAKHCWTESRLRALSPGGPQDVVAAVSCEKGGVFEYDGRVLIFKSRPDASFPRKADQSFQIQNALYWYLSIGDLDGDDKVELTVPAVKLGIWAMIRAATTHKVSFDFVTVGMGSDGAFDPGKTWKDSVTLRLSPSKYDIPVILFANADRDKLADLIVGAGADEVCVYKGVAGNPERRFASSPTLCFHADPYATFSKADLDGDGRDELIIEQAQSKAPGQLSVIQFP